MSGRRFSRMLATFAVTVGSIGLSIGTTAVATNAAPAPTATAITTGGHHSCAVVGSGGAVKCWGLNNHGQLGDRTWTTRTKPVSVSGLNSGIAAVDAGASHTCALTRQGGVLCWGSNDHGQLGDGTLVERAAPVQVAGLSGVVAISVGTTVSCALTSAGAMKCWGANDLGQLGDATGLDQTRPVDVQGLTSGVAAISAGGGHTCALTTTGGVKCWGNNNNGQLGTNVVSPTYFSPADVAGLESGVRSISAGLGYTCGLREVGDAVCWGSNQAGNLGDGTAINSATPVVVQGLPTGQIVSIAAGGWHTCVILTGGAAKCWGMNTSAGKLGDGTTVDRYAPVAVVGLGSGTAAIATAIFHHTCALMTTGGLRCWGYNGYGQVGDGTTTNRLTPTIVSGFAK